MSVKLANKDISRYGVLAAEIGLCLLLLFLLLKIVMAFVLTADTGLAPKADVAPIATDAVVREVESSNILSEFDFFHRKQPDVAPAPILQNVAETTLDLKVFGMRADLGGDSSSAIIQTPDMKQATYYIGDEIIPNVTLQSVEVDFVILDRNGVNERLSRQGRTEDELNSGTSSLSIANEALAFKANEMINNLRFYPQREGREIIGYRVLARRGNTLESYGFQQNDIITSINGEDMTQARVNLPNLWKNFKLARYASIQVLRNGRPVTIEVNLK